MKSLTIIVPLVKYDAEVEKYLHKAVVSFGGADYKDEATLCFVGPKEVLDEVKKVNEYSKYAFVVNEGNTNIQGQINAAVNACTTDYFSVLEFDDTFTTKWFDNVEKYIDAAFDISAYLPLTEVVSAEHPEEGSIGYSNEAVWASSFSDEIGYYDIECLKDYFNFNCSGAVFKKDDFLEVGGLKESMKIVYWYELLLRLIQNKKRVYVIPKVGYIHLIKRAGSATEVNAETISQEESDWWVETAQKEYLFTQDRNKTYEE